MNVLCKIHYYFGRRCSGIAPLSFALITPTVSFDCAFCEWNRSGGGESCPAAEEDVVLAVLLNWAKVWGSFLHYVATLDSNSNSKATWAIRALKKFVQRHRHRHSHRQQHHHHHHHDGRHQDNCETFVKRLGVEVFALFGCSSCGNCVRIVRRRHSGSHFRWKEQEQGKIAVETWDFGLCELRA